MDRDEDGFTPLMMWIAYRPTEPIPNNLYYPNCQTVRNKNKLTPLELWIIFGCGQPIPKELYYEGC